MATVESAWAEARPAVRARARWLLTARESQLTPAGRWNVWLYMAGRGAGKTRAAAEDLAYYGVTRPGSRLAVVAPTYPDARDTCMEGESGILACLPREEVKSWNRSLGELVLHNRTRFKLLSSDEPDRLRGPQHHRAWCDELAAFRYAETWDMLQMGLRLGERPQAVVTTTPRPTALMKALLDRDDVHVTRGATWDNAANLAPAALDALRRRYEGTRLGRQELEGLLIDELEGALFKREWIEAARVTGPPPTGFQRTVLGLDPADGNEESDEQAITVASRDIDGELYVRRSVGHRESPMAWLTRAVGMAVNLGGEIVVEKNHGGGYLVELLERVMRDRNVRVPYRAISASQGKRTRAEPVAGLFEQGHVHMIGEHPELEDQLCGWDGTGASPDRLDSMVFAITELMGYATGAWGTDDGVVAYSEGRDRLVADWA